MAIPPPPPGLALLVLLLVAGAASGSPAATRIVGCVGRLVLLAPCVSFVQGAAPAPADACCYNLLDVLRDQPGCLCPLLDGTLPLPAVNRSLALQLPALCRLNVTADADTCPLLSLPPLSSPESQPSASINSSSPDQSHPSKGSNASSTATGRDAAKGSKPPLRMNSQAMGVHSGARLELVRTSSLAFVIVGLQLVGAF